MSDTTVTDQTPEAAPVETPQPAPEPSLDDLLSEYDAATQPDGLDTPTEAPVAQDDSVDAILRDLNADTERANSLQSELDSLRAAEFQRAEREAFDKFSGELQSQLGPNVPDDYAKLQLLAMSVERPELAEAWRFRNLTDAERQVLDREFQQLEVLYWKAQRAPDDPRKASALAEMERRGRELGLAMNARTIISNAKRDVLNRAAKVQPPINEEATALKAEIAFHMKSQGKRIPDPPPNLGRLSDAEFRNYTRENFGF